MCGMVLVLSILLFYHRRVFQCLVVRQVLSASDESVILAYCIPERTPTHSLETQRTPRRTYSTTSMHTSTYHHHMHHQRRVVTSKRKKRARYMTIVIAYRISYRTQNYFGGTAVCQAVRPSPTVTMEP